jgi:hypothetical protein
MKPILIKRYSTIKTCTQQAKQFATLTQKLGAIPVAEVERLRGYNECADGTQALLFVAGLLPYLKTFVDDRIEEDSKPEQILKWAVKGEQLRGHNGHSIHAVQVEEHEPPREREWAAEMTEMESRYKNLLSAEIAGMKASYKDTGAKLKAKPTTRGSRGGGNSSNRGGGARGDLPPLPPMAQWTSGSTAAAACSGVSTSRESVGTQKMRPGRSSRQWTKVSGQEPNDSKRPKVKGTINRAAVQFPVDSGASV